MIKISLDSELTNLALSELGRFKIATVDVDNHIMYLESEKKKRTAIRKLNRSKVLGLQGSLSYLGDPYRQLLKKLETV